VESLSEFEERQSADMSITARRATKLMVCLVAVLATAATATADTQVVSATNDLVIVRDYSTVTVSAAAAKSSRLYIGRDQFILGSLSPADQDAVRAITIAGLQSKVVLVPRKQDANLVAQVTMYPTTNIPLRSPRHVLAHGLVMMAICTYPITDMMTDCENLTYVYFADYKPTEIYQKIFSRWLDAIFVSGR
jgi:hypothetical protein